MPGAGFAGLRAALAVPPELQVLVVTKDSIQQSNSSYAQGGIAGVLSPEDRFENHIEDTLIAGAGLCDGEIVELVVRGTAFSERIAGDCHLLRLADGHLAVPGTPTIGEVVLISSSRSHDPYTSGNGPPRHDSGVLMSGLVP